ncbi:hypothetical protein JCM11491_006441 [Sporobolomyces phaffii]
MLSLLTRSLLASAPRPLARASLPSSSTLPLLRSFSHLSLARPTLPSPLPKLSEQLELQTRTFKMPSCMRKKSSPVARNSGAGKTARKHSARRAKRRRQRAKKIN